jgi:hypothetical protein
MTKREIEFILPVGYVDGEGVIHKKGKMREATALDEIEIYNEDEVQFNHRYYDVFMLARVITKLGNISPVDKSIIQDMFEVDFRYLQTLYKELNGELEREAETICPECNSINKINLSRVYENLDFYFKKDKNQEISK